MNMHFRAVGRYLAAKGYDSAIVEDARQHAFVQAWGKMKAGDWHTIENPEAWLKKVALRQAPRSLSPTRRREIPLALHENALVMDDPSEEVIAALITEEAIRSLDPISRIVATMDRDGFTSHEMAERLSISEQRVRDLRKRYLRQLRRFFLKQSAGEVGG
ncbi:RNA polymerase sigma factor [Herbidospora daliensis]|uniref:RNA polymerase sigma factor n=1 Tax=Herbidospora daliensis TaxID=295585 RepID=UPI000B19696C|nr:sigma-70 family RNA polymerase sigma factor [Herbidospora daliensis]